MIVANIKDAKRYYSLNENFKTVFDFLETLTQTNLPEGISGDGYKVNLSGKYADTFDLTPNGEPRPFEAHVKYIDIHYCIDGKRIRIEFFRLAYLLGLRYVFGRRINRNR